MTLSEYRKYFAAELADLYTLSESAELFSIFIEKLTGHNKFVQRQIQQENLTEEETANLEVILRELKRGKPFQQILGETEFFGLKFFVNEHVLIPRPETEELLEVAIEKIKNSDFHGKDFKILDIGTGSGIIPIVLKKNFPEAQVFAIDYSEEALKTAKRNANFHKVEIEFMHQDYLNVDLRDVFDVIISNPPYIAQQEESEIAVSVKKFEPKMALFSPTNNALVFYEKITKDCEKHLSEDGLVFLEINQKLGKETRELFSEVLSETFLLKDISGNERMVWGRK